MLTDEGGEMTEPGQTPRTDALLRPFQPADTSRELDLAHLARELEQSLAAAQEALRQAQRKQTVREANCQLGSYECQKLTEMTVLLGRAVEERQEAQEALRQAENGWNYERNTRERVEKELATALAANKPLAENFQHALAERNQERAARERAEGQLAADTHVIEHLNANILAAEERAAQAEAGITKIHQLCKRGNETKSHGIAGDIMCILDHVAELQVEAEQAEARAGELEKLLERCRTVLGNMALENEGAIFHRWPISHEPLRNDARGLVPLIDAALAQPKGERHE